MPLWGEQMRRCNFGLHQNAAAQQELYGIAYDVYDISCGHLRLPLAMLPAAACGLEETAWLARRRCED